MAGFFAQPVPSIGGSGSGGMGWMGPPDPPYPGAAVPQVQIWHPGPPPPNYTGPIVPRPDTRAFGQPIKVGGPAPVADPNNPNAQLTGGGGGSDYETQFRQIMGGLPATPANLAAKEKELQAAGFRVVRSGDGTAGKVALPNGGPIVDVIQGAHAGGGGAWTWQMPNAGGAGAGSIGAMGGYNDGKSPSDILKATPGFQFRFDEGLDALQRGAAAKGTLLTGGTLKDIVNYGQNFASNEFQNQWMRDMDLARMGAGAAGALGDFGSAYGSNMINAANNYGTAGAAGSAAQGNIWGNVVGQVGGVLSKKPWEKPANPNSPTSTGGGSFSPYNPPSLGQAGPQ